MRDTDEKETHKKINIMMIKWTNLQLFFFIYIWHVRINPKFDQRGWISIINGWLSGKVLNWH